MAIIVHGVRICCSVFLSVQCYAWTEYKFTSVCLSVCVSVTLSVNSPTGQTPQRIFTVDSLTDADLHKGVPFGSLDHIQGCKVPQNPHFGGLNRHFKPNMRKIQIATSSDLCIRLTWNLTGSCGQQQRLCGWSRMVVKQFQDGGRPPFWKSLIVISSYLSEKSSDFWPRDVHPVQNLLLGTKFQFYKARLIKGKVKNVTNFF